MSVSVIIGVFGGPEWDKKAKDAEFSALNQSEHARDVLVVRGDTLAEARNRGAKEAMGEWLIFLDADDMLDYYYIESMLKVAGDQRILLQPATRGFYPDGHVDNEANVIPPAPNLLQSNHMVIGTMVSKVAFNMAGGFNDLPVLEDWDLWIRVWLNGGGWVAVPEAVYWVGVNPDSRNTNDVNTYQYIRSKYLQTARERGLA